MPYYQKQKRYLRLELKKIQAENAALAKKILAGRQNISQTEHRISAAVDEWKVRIKSKVNLDQSRITMAYVNFTSTGTVKC